MAFEELGITVTFQGNGVEETGIVTACANEAYSLPLGKEVVAIDPRYFRPTEVELLIGDPTKSKSVLGWEPAYDLPALVREMMASDIELFAKKEVTQLEHLIG
jgi:GDPmannose 4,6-dehydratase